MEMQKSEAWTRLIFHIFKLMIFIFTYLIFISKDIIFHCWNPVLTWTAESILQDCIRICVFFSEYFQIQMFMSDMNL
jgi:hypothetical protein